MPALEIEVIFLTTETQRAQRNSESVFLLCVLYGRLPCGKRVFEARRRRVKTAASYPGFPSADGNEPPAGRALMVIREVGADLCDGLRSRLAPGHRSALPDPRSDRFAITSSTLLAHSVGITLQSRRTCSLERSARFDADPVRVVVAAVGHHCPGNARHLVGQGHCSNVRRAPQQKLLQPLRLFLRLGNHSACAVDEQRAQVRIAAFADVTHASLASRAGVRGHQTQGGGELAPASPPRTVA